MRFAPAVQGAILSAWLAIRSSTDVKMQPNIDPTALDTLWRTP